MQNSTYFYLQDFVNERYLEKIVDKNDPTQLEYKWGSRAENELTYRSVLQFVANVSFKLYNIFTITSLYMYVRTHMMYVHITCIYIIYKNLNSYILDIKERNYIFLNFIFYFSSMIKI